MKYEVIERSPVLISKTSKGKKKFWRGYICCDEVTDKWFIYAAYWQELKDNSWSNQRFSIPYETKPKNLGKSNETTAKEQAYLEFDSMVKLQKDKGYIEEGALPNALPLPMLAQKYVERKHTLTWPVYVQPKYNGMRMLYDGEKGWSRGGKLIIPEVIQHLKFNTHGYIVDGELILPGNPKLQETMTAVKKFRPGLSNKLLYIVYDLIDPESGFEKRIDELYDIFKGIPADGPIQLSFTYSINTEDHILICHKQFKKEGYEGIIIRNCGEGYQIGQRSNQLQKFKTMKDAEFIITAVREGEGSYKGCAVFQCMSETGILFECNPEGSIEYKRTLYEDRANLIGKYLTVRHQELSSAGVPLFPVGVSIRTNPNEDL